MTAQLERPVEAPPLTIPEGLDDEIRGIVEQVANSVGDVATARSMPAAAYTSERFYEFEKDTIFRRSWLFLCHASQIPNPGDSYSVTVANEPLIVLRDQQGEIRVLSAVCQHRAYVIPDVDRETMRLRCPYHFWTYELDGSLYSAPSMRPSYEIDQLREDIALPSFPVEVWEGMVFANLDPNAAPLTPTLGPLAAELAPFDVASLVVVHEMSFPDLPFNWKNMQENALEEYHTTYIHKGWHENAPARLVQHYPYTRGDAGVYRHAPTLVRAGEPVDGYPLMPAMPGLPEECYNRVLFLAVPPLNFMAIEAMGIKMFRITPQSADRTTLTIQWLYPQSTLDLPHWDQLWDTQVMLVDAIDRPDLDSNTRVFAGLQSQYAPTGPYSPQEATLPQFNEWLLERYVTPVPPKSTCAVASLVRK